MGILDLGVRALLPADAGPNTTQFPGLALGVHVFFKGIQGGSCAGFLAALPRKQTRRFVNWSLYCRNGGIAGGTLALLALLGKAATDETMDAAGITDRGNKLFLNREQQRLDITCATLGAVWACAGYSGRRIDAGRGGGAGIVAGCVVYFGQQFLQKHLSKDRES